MFVQDYSFQITVTISFSLISSLFFITRLLFSKRDNDTSTGAESEGLQNSSQDNSETGSEAGTTSEGLQGSSQDNSETGSESGATAEGLQGSSQDNSETGSGTV